MAAGNTVSLTFAGDSSSLERTFSNVGGSAKKMAGDLDSAGAKAKGFGGAMDSAAGAADASESKFMGAADLLDGLGGAFGLPTEGATNMMRSFGDLSGGFAVLGPMVGGLKTMFMGLSTTLMAPPMGIILLIAALAAGLVFAYQKSETFRNIVQGAFDAVKNAIAGAFNWVKDHWPLLLGILTGPIGLAVVAFIRYKDQIIGALGGAFDAVKNVAKGAFNLIAKAWNNTVGKLRFEIPSWVPGGLGGKGFSMPQLQEFHRGGVVPGAPGTEVPIMAMAGETVTPAGAGGGGTTVIQLVLDGRVVTEVVHNGLLAKQRRTPLGLAT